MSINLYKKINKAVISIEKTQPIKQSEDKKEDKGTELNFDHIKNVIKRLEYYPLSVADKKTVNTLSEQIEETEKNGETKESKNRINESLGAILKIMAKYKV